jgi:hypothetical protein
MAAGDTTVGSTPTVGISREITEEFEEGGGEEGVDEFEGVAASAAQPVCLLQLPSDPPLFRQLRQWNTGVQDVVIGDSRVTAAICDCCQVRDERCRLQELLDTGRMTNTSRRPASAPSPVLSCSRPLSENNVKLIAPAAATYRSIHSLPIELGILQWGRLVVASLITDGVGFRGRIERPSFRCERKGAIKSQAASSGPFARRFPLKPTQIPR